MMDSLFPNSKPQNSPQRGPALQNIDRFGEHSSSDSESGVWHPAKKNRSENPYDGTIPKKSNPSADRFLRNSVKRNRMPVKRGRSRTQEERVMSQLLGEKPEYTLYALIEDKDGIPDENRFSKQPLRVVEALLQGLLEVPWKEVNKASGFKITKFKRGSAKYFTSEVQVFSEAHLKRLLETVKIGEFEVKIQENFKKNCVDGTLKDFRQEFGGESDSNIKNYFHSKGKTDISFVKRLGKSDVILLSFRGQKKPNHIDVGVRRFEIRDYVQKPPRCFKCQEYSHPKQTCKSEVFKCYRCGLSYAEENTHIPKDCQEDAKCCNCKENHMAGNARCKVEIIEKKYQKIMAEKGISRRETVRLYPDGEVASFADVAAIQPATPVSISGNVIVPSAASQPDTTISTILEQNKVILEKLEAVTMIQRNYTPDTEALVDKDQIENILDKKLNELTQKFEQLSKKQQDSELKISNLQKQLVQKDNTIAKQGDEIERLTKALENQRAELIAKSVIVKEGTASDDLLKCNVELIKKNDGLSKMIESLRRGLPPPKPPDDATNTRD